MRKAIVMAVLLVLGSSVLTACASTGGTDTLTGTTWYLVSGSESSPAWHWTVPADAQVRYTIHFEKDSTFASQADCNRVSGTWEARGSDRLTITPGPMTMAFCGQMSLDILYAGLLGQVSNWTVASTGLSLTLGDGGRLDYTSVAPPTPAPSEEQTPSPTPTPATTVTATATATATATVTATPTASASSSRPRPSATPSTPPKPTPSSPPKPSPTPKPTATPTAPTGPSLTGRNWHLASFALKTPAFEGSVPADRQAGYTLEFNSDGTFSAQADCNSVHGVYAPPDTSSGHGELTLTPGPATVKACGEGSYGDLYLTAIGNTVSFTITGEHLTLALADSGTLQYG